MLEARIFDLTIHCFPSIVCWPSWWPEAGELNRSSLTSSVVPRQLMKHSLGWGWDLYNETMVLDLQYSANVLYMYGYVILVYIAMVICICVYLFVLPAHFQA